MVLVIRPDHRTKRRAQDYHFRGHTRVCLLGDFRDKNANSIGYFIKEGAVLSDQFPSFPTTSTRHRRLRWASSSTAEESAEVELNVPSELQDHVKSLSFMIRCLNFFPL